MTSVLDSGQLPCSAESYLAVALQHVWKTRVPSRSILAKPSSAGWGVILIPEDLVEVVSFHVPPVHHSTGGLFALEGFAF